MTNKDSTLPPIPHLHSLLTDNGEPHPEVDIFKLVRSSYEVMHRLSGDVCAFPDLKRSCLTNRMAPPLPVLSPLLQKFGSIRADVIEQMRFKQRLRVIQTIEDTTKRNVVRTRLAYRREFHEGRSQTLGSLLLPCCTISGQNYRHGDRFQHRRTGGALLAV